MTDYAGIRDYKSLMASLDELQTEIAKKEERLGIRYETVKEFYSPSNVAVMLARSLISSVDWISLLLRLVRKLKSALGENDNKH